MFSWTSSPETAAASVTRVFETIHALLSSNGSISRSTHADWALGHLCIAAHGDSRPPYLMQQAALRSLSEQYFVVLGAMLSAYARGELANRRFVPSMRSPRLRASPAANVAVHLAALCQPTAKAMMDFRFMGSYLTHERPTRPISKAKASGRETGSIFCSRRPDRQLAHRL